MPYASSIVRPLVGEFARPIPGSETSVQVFLLAGQSNMVGRAPFDGGEVYPDGVYQYNRAGVLEPATIPLDHHDAAAGDMGLAVQFAIDFRAANPNTDLVLVPAAQGGTGFSDGQWNVGAPLYADLVSRANSLFLENPSFQLAGILWHQGERDPGYSGYADALVATVAGLRNDIAAASPATPFILGELLPDFTEASAANAAINAAIKDVPNRLTYTAVVSAELPDRLTGLADGVHFDAASLRVLGPRYLAALPQARANRPTVPDIIDDLAVQAANESAILSWTAPGDGGSSITDYRIERSLDGVDWVVVEDGLSVLTEYTDTGLTNGVEYLFRISAVNDFGVAPASAPMSVMPDLGAASVLSTAFAATTDDGLSHSFAGVDLGQGGTVFVAAVCRGDTSQDALTGMTIGGQSATLLTLNKAFGNYLRFGYVTNAPAGPADVQVTHLSSQSRLGIHVWVLKNVDPAGLVTADAQGSDNAIDCFAEGLVLGVAASVNPASNNVDWTGIDERQEWTDYGDRFGSSSADLAVVTAESGRPVTIATDGNFKMTSLVSLPKP